jgi:NAD(P)-dependent dehydrogenase (short-subunit alcohol dehydrogenase family)
MSESASDIPAILVTGGTSGLGLEIVKTFLKRGYFVVATGRKEVNIPGYENRFRLYRIDFCDLKEIAKTIRTICNNHPVGVVINNAGILSPPDFRTTRDGNEYTFQVNFLGHLLINEIIIKMFGKSNPILIAAITSMVYKLAGTEISYCRKKEEYSPLKAYSDSKLFLAMMCKYLPARHEDVDLTCFSLDPGVFGSSIYRMQKGWFRFLYWIAAPFMRRPSVVAEILAKILTNTDIHNGVIYNIRRKVRHLKEFDPVTVCGFWEECYSILKSYIG